MVPGGDHASPPYLHLGFSRAFSSLRWPRSPPLAAPWLRWSVHHFSARGTMPSVSASDAEPIHDVSNPFQAFQDLMPFRVQDILLVSSLYDSFTLQEDGRLNELIAGEFLELSLHHTPGLTHVSTGHEALALARSERRFNLILSTLSPADMDATEIAREVKRAG